MTEGKVAGVKNREKKYKRKRGRVSNETRGKKRERKTRAKPVTLFLEITIPGRRDPGDPEIILWSFHPEGARGTVCTNILRKLSRRVLLAKALKIYDAHQRGSLTRRARVLRDLHKADDWSERISSVRKLKEARARDRKRQLDEARGRLVEPLDFDDFDAIIKDLTREE